ncbi:MAG: DUF4105 domain-containing protein [Ferruginibacter sp.]|nr:DUF4105 domain-containing protein [Ferruginibacter sp.]
MKKYYYGFLLYLIVTSTATAFAQDSSHIRISLLTCTPGEELYSIFGHSAIRIVDSSRISENDPIEDLVYNYGTFNFDDEGFYLKFIRGKLLYYVSLQKFKDDNQFYGFESSYKMENRGITEQVLDLSAPEKIAIQHRLNENLKEENKYYNYDFFLDNCTTRLRDIIIAAKNPNPILPGVMPMNTTFRNAIHQYLDKGRQYWSKLGIDILLGAPTDAVMSSSQQQFLPDNLMKALDNTRNVQIVKKSSTLYNLPQSIHDFSWFTPLVFFSLLLLLFITMGLSKNRRIQVLLAGLDGTLFFMTGVLGVVLIFMMTATDHSMTKSNYNILWALPSHAVISFFISSKRKVVKTYFLVTAGCMAVLLLSWFFLPQQMSYSLVPFVLLLLYRSATRCQKL